MLLRSDPFRELDRLTQQAFGTRTRPAFMPMDAYRHGDQFVVSFDLPGIEPSAIDLTIEKNVLTVTAERPWQPTEDEQVVASERPHGRFSRQVFLGESLDTERVEATYEQGVLSLTIPVVEQAEARKVEITSGGGDTTKAIDAESTAA